MGIASDLIAIVVASLIGGVVAHFLRQPIIVGYIAAGVALGPHTGGHTLSDIHDVEKLAEIGVALLLFALGLEFSFSELKRVLKIALFGTPLQLILTTFIGYYLGIFIVLSWQEAIWFGSLLSLSSTMVVLKTLTMQNGLNSLASKLMIGMLIAQDLAIVPMMLVLPQITQDTISYQHLAYAIGKSVIFLVLMVFLGIRLLPKFFSFIANKGPRELFFLLTLTVALGIGYLTYLMGLSFPLGAFVAGMVLSETDFSHQALGEIGTLRDLFGLLFFVSVGMLLDPSLIVNQWKELLLTVVVIMTAKAIIIGVIIRLFGYRGVTPYTVGLGLSQVGEFAFAIGTMGVSTGNLSSSTYSFCIAITILTMILTPFLMRSAKSLYGLQARFFNSSEFMDDEIEIDESEGHVVIAGAGVIGEYVAKVLKSLNLPFVLVEVDHRRVVDLRKHYDRVIFGDVSHTSILEAAGISTAKLLILSLSDSAAIPKALLDAKKLSPNLPVVVRLDESEKAKEIFGYGALEIVQPKYEAALELLRQSLLVLGTTESVIFGLMSQLRIKNYALTALSAQKTSLVSSAAAKFFEFDWVEIPPKSKVINATLADLQIRVNFGVSVVAIVRQDDLISAPGSSDSFLAGDLVGFLGTKGQVESFRKFLLTES